MPDAAVIHVACLCAAWCRTCDAYAAVLDEVLAAWPGGAAALQRHWIDIEDEADLVGEFEVETFPTIVIADARQVRFAGPLTPQPETLQRLLRATLLEAGADARWPAVDAEIEAFAARLRARAVLN